MTLDKQPNASYDPAQRRTSEPDGVGKRPLVMDLPRDAPVHVQKAQGTPAAQDPQVVQAAAARGVATPSSPLPYASTIQRLFGRHDVSDVQAHVGNEAAASARAMSAEAYATGNHVAFAGTPSLHTAAHEAAHIVQQRGGVQLKGGVGQVGDVYEKHADEVADLVVQGKSAEAALDRHAGSGSSHAPATDQVQRFYVESSDSPGYEWLDNDEWDVEKYELSPNQPTGWMFYRVYREKADPKQQAHQARAREQRWRKKLEALRGILATQERDPKKFDAAAARSQIDAALDAALSGITGDELAARVEEIRVYVDALPGYFADHVVNAAHARVDKRGPQIGIPGVGYLPPGKTTDPKNGEHVVSRGISEVVLIEGKWYAPVYQTVFGDALAPSSPQYDQQDGDQKGGPKFKDTSQGAGGQVELHSGSAAGSDGAYWCSIGRPLRQLKWMDKYALDPNATEPLIRSFLIPVEVADAISGGAVTEHNTSGMNLDLIVDKHYERNQFGVVNRESFEKLRQLALPGSLRTYTDGAIVGRPEAWGDVRHASELRERVDVPGKPIPGFDVVVDTKSADKGFTKKDDYPKQADTLMRIHAYYTGNAEFLPVDTNPSVLSVAYWTGRPPREKMPGESDRKRQVHAFFIQHKPAELNDDDKGLATFMSEYVAPWASQARIAQEISEDYDIISDKDNPAGITTDPEPVYFAGTTAPALRGQRRPGAMAQSREQQALMAERERLLIAAKAATADITKVFLAQRPPNKLPGNLPRLLNQLKTKLNEIPTDYDFYIGRVEVVAAKLPEHRKDISTAIDEISTALQTNNAVGSPHSCTALIEEIVATLRKVTT